MPLSGLDIQQNLQAFAKRWQPFAGTEKAEAQTFLNELFECYGHKRQEVGAKFEDFKSSAGFMDLHWPGICIVEMKKPGTILASAREQVHRYRNESADEEAGVPAAKYVVICSFQQFEIWQPGDYPKSPRAVVSLLDLPSRYDVLNFFAGSNIEPSFVLHDRQMTKDAAERVAMMYQSLADRSAAPGHDIARFVMQSVWCMFAEDLQMLQGWPFEKTVELLISDQSRNSASDLGFLFRVLNQKGKQNREGILAGTTFVNGDLFSEPAEVRLNVDELRLLREAIGFNWSQVDPTIFGSLMEGVLGDRRWELGAHYTHEVDIMKIVSPTIVQPWNERIEAVTSPIEARQLLEALCEFKVLDPACGCGNFLYVAYRELRALEALLKGRMRDLAHQKGLPVPSGPLPFVPLTNMQGIEIEPMAALIARVTLWIGHRQMIDLYGAAEDPLPLVTLSTIRTGDALNIKWPETDCIIGNPPFVGASHMRANLGDEYVEWLSKQYKVGVKDLCVYWFRRTSDHLRPGQRAGLVGTNSISQNLGRSASLDYIKSSGGVITDAVSSQQWPGDANVHVSIVNWVDQPVVSPTFVLDGVAVVGIGSDLREQTNDQWIPQRLNANRGRCFEGPSPKAKGLLVSESEALALRARVDADYSQVVREYLTAADITDDPAQAPSRWAIDFGVLPLEQAMKFPAAYEIVRDRVKPERRLNRDVKVRDGWWMFGRPRPAMREQLIGLDRYIAVPGHAKRFHAIWCDAATLASNATDVFAFDDDFSMGVIQSRAHIAWAWQQSSTLETRLRYTPTSVFETFPWPDQSSEDDRNRVSEICREFIARRSILCLNNNIGLTKLYNALDDGAYTDLVLLHRELDEAVANLYGWPASVAQDDKELVQRLSKLNRRITAREQPYLPFAG